MTTRIDLLVQVRNDAARVRKAQAELDARREVLIGTLKRARATKTLRELAEATGYSLQRIAQMTEEKKAPAKPEAGKEEP